MGWWPFGKKKEGKAAKASMGREGPPGKPEGAKCGNCGANVSTIDIERGECPKCHKRL
jgi:hypothetical protein